MSLLDSWPFILFLLVLLVGNELWKKHYQRLTFQISILFISIYLFLVFLLPVLFHRLGADIFVLSGILSLIIVFLFTLVLKKYTGEKFKIHHNTLRLSVIIIFIMMNVLYFTNIIPPIPLSLKEAGVYHNITRNNAGNYLVQAEAGNWLNYFKQYPVFHKSINDSVYVFSAVFSPTKFEAEIVHQWQYYDEVKKEWIDSSKITLPITGGREEGFRTYSFKRSIIPGLWRVKVINMRGQVLGKINFKVETSTSTPDLVTKTY